MFKYGLVLQLTFKLLHFCTGDGKYGSMGTGDWQQQIGIDIMKQEKDKILFGKIVFCTPNMQFVILHIWFMWIVCTMGYILNIIIYTSKLYIPFM